MPNDTFNLLKFSSCFILTEDSHHLQKLHASTNKKKKGMFLFVILALVTTMQHSDKKE